jgi:hypothetical protein
VKEKPDPSPDSVTQVRATLPFGALAAQALVIVASVLFALAVDRVVLGLDERALEHAYLEGLADDFRGVEAATAYAMRTASMRDSAAALVLATLRGDDVSSISPVELAKALELAGWVIDVQLPSDSWDDMAATGNLRILRNSRLRQEIAAFYGQVEQLHAFATDWTMMTREYSDVARTLLPPELRVAIGLEYTYQEAIPDDVHVAANLAERIEGARALEAPLGDVLLINKVSARLYAALHELATGIGQLLESEIKG